MANRDLPISLDHVGVVGLGTMGGGMASRLLDRGHQVTVYNRTASRAEPLRERGATVLATPAEVAARVDVVLVSLADQDVVRAALTGADGVFGALRRGGVVLDASTVPPEFAREMAARAADAGCTALDTCVLGNGTHARDGELRFMVGGDEATFEWVRPLLADLGKEVTLLGHNGSGTTMKLVLNMLMGIEMQALAEAVTLGEQAGLDRAAVLATIAASGFSSPVMKFKCGVMARQAYRPADFRLALMRKDMALVRAEGQRLGVPTLATDAAYTLLTAAGQQGLGDLDCAAVLAQLESWSGAVVPPPRARPGATADTARRVVAGTPPSRLPDRPGRIASRP